MALTSGSGCAGKPARDLGAVIAAHDRALLAEPGVVGVYAGLMDDGKTPGVRVMLARPDAALERRLPRALDGYPVAIEVSGEIRPMKPAR